MRPTAARSRTERVRWALASWLVVAGCIEDRIVLEQEPGDEEQRPPRIDDREVILAEVPPPPIFGGTLTVIPEAAVAVVSDPDRDLVVWVDLDALEVTRTTTVAAGAWPWRSVADDEGRVHVVLRGVGRVLTLDVADGRVVHDRAVCSDPRGLDVRHGDGAVIVACADGRLRALPADGGAAETIATVDADLRDVIVHRDGSLEVSRFRSTTVLALDPQGALVGAVRPDSWRAETSAEGLDLMLPHTAWRTVPTPDGGWLMAHQAASDRELAAPPEDDDSHGPAYQGRGNDCSAIVQSGLSRYSRADGTSSTGPIAGVVLPVDVAVSPDGRWAGVASAATGAEGGHLHAVLVALDELAVQSQPPCHEPIEIELPDQDAQIVAVAFDSTSRLLVQAREPARLYRVDNYDLERIEALTLTTLPRLDTGHQSFHEDPGTSITCASCHPEGGDDGHVWSFEELGPRHTPSLEVPLRGTEPFHWSGELEDFTALVDDVFVRRMGAAMPTAERKGALEQWIYTIGRDRFAVLDDAAERGAAAWDTFECGSCHTGAALTNNGFAMISTYVPMQVPSLRAVGLHPPYMHDGHAQTLEGAVREMIEATAPSTAVASDDQIADLVAYLRVL